MEGSLYPFQKMLIGCMFIIIEISQHPFIDFFDFCSFFFRNGAKLGCSNKNLVV